MSLEGKQTTLKCSKISIIYEFSSYFNLLKRYHHNLQSFFFCIKLNIIIYSDFSKRKKKQFLEFNFNVFTKTVCG